MRFLGVEDGSFTPHKFQSKGKTILCGVLTNGLRIEEVSLRLIDVDGLDATEKLLDIAKHLGSLDMIILGGVTFGGFNIIDPVIVHEELKVPVVIVTAEKPDNEAVFNALKKHFKDWKIRYEVFEKLASISPIYEVKLNPKENPTFLEVVGIEFEKAFEILRRITIRGRIPEPVRIANRIAKAVSRALLL
ncbi:MAG: DUF99 family protein [Candidatus Nezhaarchaeota archaeon]|nr:DUF99 family protein [Candidatus Nezhaarchaeota archaeon]